MRSLVLFFVAAALAAVFVPEAIHAQCTGTCPRDTTVRTDSGKCSAAVSYPDPVLSGCTLGDCFPRSGTEFVKGETLVTCENSDGDPVCSFTVTVVDSEPPTFVTCPDTIKRSLDPGHCRSEIDVANEILEAQDNCGFATIFCSTYGLYEFPVGTTPVSCYARDDAGNISDTCKFVVQVTDNIRPRIEGVDFSDNGTLSCGLRAEYQNDPGRCSASVYYNPSASDNCEIDTIICYPPSGTAFPVGASSVTCYARDVNGNVSDTCRFDIRVYDAEAPRIDCPRDTTVQTCDPSGATVGYPAPRATDNCSDTISISCSPDSGSFFPVGETEVDCLARDKNHNGGNCHFFVYVEENSQPPVITDSSATPAVLWPPNHKMRDIAVSYTALGTCPSSCRLEVTSNEPIDGTGDGDTSPDWVVVDSQHVQLRAERAGDGGGRIYTVSIICTNTVGESDTATVPVVVAHDISSPISGTAFKVGTTVNFAGTFWDVPGNKHTAQWTFDNSSTKGTVTEPSGLKNGKVTGSYKFNSTGVYRVQMNITDQHGVTTTTTTQGDLEAIVVIYDPKGGYAMGGGWFAAPAGSFPADSSLTGKAGYGFSISYFKNATNPKGETDFEFNKGGLEFSATNFDYLAISGDRAQLKGAGKVTGDAASYNFILTVIDGQLPGGGGVDKARMKIYDKNTNEVVFDSQLGASDADDPSAPVGGASTIAIVPNGGMPAGTVTHGDVEEEPPAETGVQAPELPQAFALNQNYPNPFNPTTLIRYDLPIASSVSLKIYNTLGQIVRTLRDQTEEEAGYRSVSLDASALPSGVYFYRLDATSLEDAKTFTSIRKMLLIK